MSPAVNVLCMPSASAQKSTSRKKWHVLVLKLPSMGACGDTPLIVTTMIIILLCTYQCQPQLPPSRGGVGISNSFLLMPLPWSTSEQLFIVY